MQWKCGSQGWNRRRRRGVLLGARQDLKLEFDKRAEKSHKLGRERYYLIESEI